MSNWDLSKVTVGGKTLKQTQKSNEWDLSKVSFSTENTADNLKKEKINTYDVNGDNMIDIRDLVNAKNQENKYSGEEALLQKKQTQNIREYLLTPSYSYSNRVNYDEGYVKRKAQDIPLSDKVTIAEIQKKISNNKALNQQEREILSKYGFNALSSGDTLKTIDFLADNNTVYKNYENTLVKLVNEKESRKILTPEENDMLETAKMLLNIRKDKIKELSDLSSDTSLNGYNKSVIGATALYDDATYGENTETNIGKDKRTLDRTKLYLNTGFTGYFQDTFDSASVLIGYVTGNSEKVKKEISERADSPYELANSALREYYSRNGQQLNKVIQDTVTNMANNAIPMLLSIAGASGANSAALNAGKTALEAGKIASRVSRVISTVSFAPSVFGNAYKEGLKSGITEDGKLLLYSFATTAAECGLEMALGSTINPAGGVLSGEIISNFSEKFNSVLIKSILKIVGNGAGEFVEEGIQSILGPLFKEWFLGTDETTIFDDPIGTLSNAAYEGFVGFLSSIFMSGFSSIQSARSETAIQANGKLYKSIAQQTNTDIKDIAQFIKESIKDKSIAKTANKVLKGDISDMAVGELISQVHSYSEESGKIFFSNIGQNIVGVQNGVNMILSVYEETIKKGAIYPEKVTSIYEKVKENLANGDINTNDVGEFAYYVEAYSPKAHILGEVTKAINKSTSPSAPSNSLSEAEQKILDTPDSQLTPEQRAVKQTILERQQKNITQNGDVYSGNIIDISADNELSELLGNLQRTEKYRKIKEYILGILGGRKITLSDGKNAVVDGRDAQHIASNAGTKKIAQISKITEIINKSKLVAEEDSTKAKKFDYFYYYEILVKDGKEIYPIYLNVGRARNDGSYHIYDITQKLRDTAHRVNDVWRPVGNAIENGISNNTVPQKAQTVNTIISTETGNNSETQADFSESANFMPEGEGDESGIINGRSSRKSLNKAEQNYIKKIAKALGREVVFEHLYDFLKARGIDASEGIPDGIYDNETGIIYIDFAAKDPILFVFKHELTHFTENTVQYAKFVKAVKKSKAFKEWLESEHPSLKGQSFEKLLAASRQIEMNKRINDPNFSVTNAEAEVIANFVGKILFREDGSKLESILSNLDYKERNAFIQFIRDFINYLKKKLAGNNELLFEISRLEDNFNRALSEATATKEFPSNDGGVRFIVSQENNSSIKQQLTAHKDEINAIGVVFNQTVSTEFNSKQEAVEWVLNRLGNNGNTVKREGFGEIVLDEKRIKSGTRYLKTKEEVFAFAAVPQVLKKGIEISSHSNHKGRGYDTITFAAPVVINAQRGNMAVVVRQEGKNYYKVHRLLMPDGSQFVFDEKRDTAERAGGVDNNSGLSPTDNVSINSIPDNQQTVNNNSMQKNEKYSENNLQFSFAREYDTKLIEEAEKKEKDGASREEIWKELGIIRDTGDVWVYEIDDSDMEFFPYGDALKELSPELKELYRLSELGRKTQEQKNRLQELRRKYGSAFYRRGKLKDYLKHDKLFKKYPRLKETNIEFRLISGKAGYDANSDTIVINSERLLKTKGLKGTEKKFDEIIRKIEFEDSIIHEIQHALQVYDEREKGASIESWAIRLSGGERVPINNETGKEFTPYDAYMATMGEYESRESVKRKVMGEDERRETMPDLGWGKTISAELLETANKQEISELLNTEYMSAVESGDIDTAQQIANEAARLAGYTEKLYHQTGAEFTEFNTENQKAGKYDWELPTGTFLKPTSDDIGLLGKRQMELFAKFQNPLKFKNRADATKFWKANVEGYEETVNKIRKINAEYREKVDNAEAGVQQYINKWRSENPNASRREIYNVPEFQQLYDKQQDIIEEWDRTEGNASLKAKKLIDGFIAENDYDGIILERDDDGKNLYTTSYIAFDSAQLKSAEAVTYDDSGKVISLNERFNEEQGDIRYSIPTEERDFTKEMNALNKRLQSGEISAADFKIQVDVLFEEAGQEYGTIKQGESVTGDENFENPVPKKVNEKQNTRQYVRTILEGGQLTEEMLGVTKEMILSGELSYTPTSNEKNMAYADKIIQGGHAEDRWNKIANCQAMPSGSDIALGEALLKTAAERKDTVATVKLIAELTELGTRLGQSVQALSLLKRMDGIGQLYYVQKAVNTLNNDLQKKYKKNPPMIVIDETLAQQLAASKTQADFEITYTAILKDIASQVPATFLDKLNAWRYMAMLFNPITHIKNFCGNVVFLPAVKIKDIIACGGERFIDQNERTKSVKIEEEYREFAKNDFPEVEEIITSGGKMNPKRSIADNKPIFKNEVMENIRKFNFDMLEKEDAIFLKLHYQRALGGYLQARKVNLKTISPTVLWRAREFAILEAQKATFRDASAIANWLAKGSQKTLIGNILIEGTLPFKKTSANVLKRSVEYSPIGLITTVGKAIRDFHSGDFTVSQLIDGLASNLTGTGIFALGMWLASSGIIRGGSDGDDEDWLDKMLGKQDYSVEIGGISYTVDWMAPACVPFFMGVSVIESLRAEDNTTAFANILEGLGAGLSPIIELSMLSGVQGALETIRYSKPKDILPNLIINSAKSYALQMLPTLGSKVANIIDPVRRTNYIDKTSLVPEIIQSVANEATTKIPFASKLKAEYINAWGEKENKGDFVTRLFQNFISPGYLSKVDIDNIEAEIKRLAKQTTNMSVFPEVAPKYIKFKNITKHLKRDEYEIYAVAKGQMSADYIKEAVESEDYQDLTDEQKAEVITNLYAFANAKAKAKLSYTYEEINTMNKGAITKEMYKGYSSKMKKVLVEEYFSKSFKTVWKKESNGGSAVDYYINLAKNKN